MGRKGRDRLKGGTPNGNGQGVLASTTSAQINSACLPRLGDDLIGSKNAGGYHHSAGKQLSGQFTDFGALIKYGLG